MMFVYMFLVADLGGTKSRLAISKDGKTLGEPLIWATSADFEVGIEKLIDEMKNMSQNIQISGIGLGIAGVVDRANKKLIKSPHLPNWIDKPVGQRIEKTLGVKVRMENDAALGGLGEAVIGAGRRAEVVGYLTVGTGIGGARIVNGKIDKTIMGFEPGHMIIDVGNRIGYWEDFASGTAMYKVYGKKAEELTETDVWENEARLLAIGIHNAIVMWSPNVVILGGSVIRSVNIDLVKKLVGEQMKIFPTIPDVKPAELGERSGLLGALVLLSNEGQF